YRMRGLDDLDLGGRRAVAVAGDDETRQRAGPRLLEGGGHLRRGLAGADDDGAAKRPPRQMRGDGARRIGRSDGSAEQVLEQIAIHGAPSAMRVCHNPDTASE